MSALDFDPELPVEAAWTPPSHWYTDAAFHRRELERVFAPSWQFAARLAQLEQPGDFVAASAAGQTWFTLRHPDGGLRAYHNVCRHHAAELCSGAGRVPKVEQGGELVCPYHAWTYDLDGALRRAPELGAARGFDRADFSLPALRVEAFEDLVFVNADPDAPALAPGLAELRRRLAAFERPLSFVERQSYELDCNWKVFVDNYPDLAPFLDADKLARLTWVARGRYSMKCNWKVFVDNYLDGGYHIAHLHRGLADELKLAGYRTEVFERLSIQSSPGSASDPRVGAGAIYAFLYPNFMINRYGCWLDTNLVLPLGEGRTRVVMDYWVERERAGDAGFVADSLAASRRIHDEDVAISESVQRGLGSRSYTRGRYAARELAMHAFHRELAADLSRD